MNYEISPLALEELADIYDEKNTGRRARTLPIDTILDWAETRSDIFYIHPENDTFHLIK